MEENVGAALREAFARLAPQGSDQWNFLGAFTHLGDRYGPYQPGKSALSDLIGRSAEEAGRKSRFRGRRLETTEKSELEEAMGHVVEAFRFLAARVATLEARLARQDEPISGAAWLAPAADIGALADPIARHLLACNRRGRVLHGDCGRGELVIALKAAGVEASGVEPRGAVALAALEQGCDVAIRELNEDLATREPASLGGLVLSGVVDRIPLHQVLSLVQQAHRVLALGAPIVVVLGDGGAEWCASPAGRDLIAGRPLHRETWEMLLDRAGFTDVGQLDTGLGDQRLVLTAATPG